MRTNNKKLKELFSDTLSFFLSNFASKILVFTLMPLYTYILSTREYGIADFISNAINVLYPILTLSIMESTLRFLFDKKEKKDEILSNSLIIIFISELFLIILTPVIYIFFKNILVYWIWFLIIYFGNNLFQILSQYTKGIGKTKTFAKAGFIQTIVLLMSNIIGLLFLKKGLFAYLFSISLGYFVGCIYLIFSAKIKLKKIKYNKNLMKKMLIYSIPTIPTLISWWISTSADKYVIIYYLGIEASGIYSVAYKIPSILVLFANLFNSAWTISAIKSSYDGKIENSNYQTFIYKYFNMFCVLVCSFLILISKPLSKILFSKDFFEAWRYVPLLLIAYVFSGLAGFLGSTFRAEKQTKKLFISSLAGALSNIILNFYFISKFGCIGAAYTTIIGFAITFYIRAFIIKRFLKIRLNLLKNSFIYLLLFIQAIFIILNLKLSFLISFFIFILIFIIYLKDIILLSKNILFLFINFLGRKNEKN